MTVNFPPTPAERPKKPKNAEKLKIMLPHEMDLFFPIEPDWAVVGALVHPRSGSLILQVRQDGAPTENAPIAGGRFSIAIEEDPKVINDIAQDLIQYFKNRGTRCDIGYYEDATSEMKIVRSTDEKKKAKA